MKQVQDYIDKMTADFGNEWPDYVPVYYSEQRSLIESWGINTTPFRDTQVNIMFMCLLLEELGANEEDYREADINLDGHSSTCEVMEWILVHGIPTLEKTHFCFPDDKILFGFFAGLPNALVVSSIPKSEVYCETPVEEWHEPVAGMRRIMPSENMKMWYAYIYGKYYFITG